MWKIFTKKYRGLEMGLGHLGDLLPLERTGIQFPAPITAWNFKSGILFWLLWGYLHISMDMNTYTHTHRYTHTRNKYFKNRTAGILFECIC